jgi:hypothetical protein
MIQVVNKAPKGTSQNHSTSFSKDQAGIMGTMQTCMTDPIVVGKITNSVNMKKASYTISPDTFQT